MSPPALLPEQRLHWKVIVRVLAICYFVPGLAAAALLAAGLQQAIVQHVGQAVAAFLGLLGLLLPPIFGGWFAARWAPALPWRHVFVVGVLGALLSMLAFRVTPRAMVVYALASVALAAFGGYIRLGGGRRDPG